MTIFRKTLQLKACQASKGPKSYKIIYFYNKGDTKYMATKLFNSFKKSFFIKEIEN